MLVVTVVMVCVVCVPQASSGVTDGEVVLEVFLVNHKSVSLNIRSLDRTDQVLEVGNPVFLVSVCVHACVLIFNHITSTQA